MSKSRFKTPKYFVGDTYKMKYTKYGYVQDEFAVIDKVFPGNNKRVIIVDTEGERRRKISSIHLKKL